MLMGIVCGVFAQQICMNEECSDEIKACDAGCQEVLGNCTFDCTIMSRGCMTTCLKDNQAAQTLLTCAYNKCLNYWSYVWMFWCWILSISKIDFMSESGLKTIFHFFLRIFFIFDLVSMLTFKNRMSLAYNFSLSVFFIWFMIYLVGKSLGPSFLFPFHQLSLKLNDSFS